LDFVPNPWIFLFFNLSLKIWLVNSDMRKILNVLSLFIFLWGFNPCIVKAQSLPPIPLNKHYFEIPAEDSANHVFNKIESYTKDSVKLERIFTLNNKINRIIRTSPKRDDFQENIIEQYDNYGNLLWKETINLANSKYLRTYFFDGEQVGQVLHTGNRNFIIHRTGDAESKESFFDDFLPRNQKVKKGEGVYSGLTISMEGKEWPEDEQQVYFGIYVDEAGNAESIEWANPLGTAQKYALQFLPVLRNWATKFEPAMDPFGNPVGKWIYLHFHIGGARRVDRIVFK
jgi:hypothetical protein